VDWIFYGEPHPYRASLSDVRVVMKIMRIFVVKLLCQEVMRQIPVLECQLPSAYGHQWLCHVLSDIK
jgi:hypothetical protein